MARSKSSQNTSNCLIALLLLWSMVSLIVIVVWVTWPLMKTLDQCREEKQVLTQKMEGARVLWERDEHAAMGALTLNRENQRKLQGQMDAITALLSETNTSLTDATQEHAALKENLTALEKEISMHEIERTALSSEMALLEGHIETLQMNVTEAFHQRDSCTALRDAANSQRVAAESLEKACEVNKGFMQRRLSRCKIEE